MFVGRKGTFFLLQLKLIFSLQDILPKHHVFTSTPVLGVILADYGATWKEHRRFALMTLRDFGLGKQSMEQRILGEIQYTVETLEKSIGMLHFSYSGIQCHHVMCCHYYIPLRYNLESSSYVP